MPTATSLFFGSLIVVAGVELLPKSLADVTSTVRARTEVLQVELQPERTYLWWLPRGSYSLLTAADAVGCEHRSRLDVACALRGAYRRHDQERRNRAVRNHDGPRAQRCRASCSR